MVVFMIGIILTYATLSLGPRESRVLKEEVQRIGSLMELARQEAVLEAQELAFALSDEGYGFHVFDGEQWLPLEEDNVLRPRMFPERIEVDVNVFGEKIAVTAPKGDSEKDDEGGEGNGGGEEENVVRIFLLSSGEMTPFELFLHFEDRDDGYLLEGNGAGELVLKQVRETL